VAESNHTNNEGGHEVSSNKGKLVHKATGKTIDDVTLAYDGTNSFDVEIVKGAGANTFYRETWKFVPDALPLPGADTVINTAGFYPLLNIGGEWFQVVYKNGYSAGPKEYSLARREERAVRDRLRNSTTTITRHGEILNREDYL
jgi:hypothetical protein